MKLAFSCSTFLALASVGTDAFIVPQSAGAGAAAGAAAAAGNTRQVQVSTSLNAGSNFMNAYPAGNPGNDGNNGDDEGSDAEAQGGSRLKDLMQASEARAPVGGIDNPFLTPAQPPPPTDFNNMSVEEQARMFREMVKGNGPITEGGPPAPKKTSPRPAGRNRDADSISNTSDLYFAQLKRDSAVRTSARYRGDDDVANAIMEDEGIDQLEDLLYSNPYLAEGRDQEQNLFETIPEEALQPYFDSANADVKNSFSGVNYKDRLMQKKGKVFSESSPNPPPFTQPAAAAPAESTPPVVEAVAAAQARQMNTAISAPLTPSSSPEETRSKIRTLMGLTLKHRGGPGFGSGRLKGGEVDQFETLLGEVSGLLREEASQNPAGASGQFQAATPSVAAAVPSSPGQVDGAIACIEGAVTMYKNSPAEIQGTVLVSLRAALQSAINTMNGVLGDAAPANAGLGQVDTAITCIEGAVTMYKNSPAEIQGTVLISLRAALSSAIATMDIALASGAPATPPPAAAATQMEPPAVALDNSFGPDENSIMLEEINSRIQAVAGDGKLGLKSDLNPTDVNAAIGSVQDLRGILMDELEGGIPEPTSQEPAESSTASKYQQMLAKARAEKGTN